jgi:NADH-quinone oxidoreductase subunit G
MVNPMVTVNIDGQDIQVEPGTNVLEAAERLGVMVPRYCYHPGLSVAGSCRMCAVEIEGMPKLQISCHTRARDGMKVSTDSEQVLRMRQAMLEFLLVNHPLDCPVCDQSGECDLQNFYMEHGLYESRVFEDKIKRKKAFPIGPHVMLDQERCILCTRCVRFCEEVSESHELGVLGRGDRSVIDLFPGRELDNNYSGNVIDICPVGALTEREFRFQCRVWYLSQEASICNGCSRGCNIAIHFNTQLSYKADGRRVQRLKPRFNPLVNQWWMCDQGRFGYGFVDRDRIENPCLRIGGELQPRAWEEVLEEVATALRTTVERFGAEGLGIIASPQQSNEELYLVRKLFQELLGVSGIPFRNPWEDTGTEDGILLLGDRNPNSRGAVELGLQGDAERTLGDAAAGGVKVLYVFGHDFDSDPARELIRQAEYVVFQGANWNSTARMAHAVLPGVTHMEKEGTFTNFEGRVQRFAQALPPLGESRPDLEILCDLAQRLDHALYYPEPEDLFSEWRGGSYQDLGEFGEVLDSNGAGAG